MTTQIAAKLPDQLVRRVDELVSAGVFPNRSAAVREGLTALITSKARDAIDGAYERTYRQCPETAEELAHAARLAVGSILEEPLGSLVVARGEIWWGEAPDEKGRPYLVISRDSANRVMQRVLVAPLTTKIRGLPSELALGRPEGLPVESVAGFDSITQFPKAMLVRRLGALTPLRTHELCAAARAALDLLKRAKAPIIT